MTHAKPRIVIAVVAISLFAAVPPTGALDSGQTSLSPQDVLTKMWASYAALSSYSDEVKTVGLDDEKTTTWHTTVKLARPNLYLVEWQKESATPPGSDPPTANVVVRFWSRGDGVGIWADKSGSQKDTKDGLLPFSGEDMTLIPFAFFGKAAISSPLRDDCCRGGYRMGTDEKVGDVDCYVLHGEQDGAYLSSITLWIGKSDLLLRQFRTANRLYTATQTHSNIVMNVPMSESDFAPMSPN